MEIYFLTGRFPAAGGERKDAYVRGVSDWFLFSMAWSESSFKDRVWKADGNGVF